MKRVILLTALLALAALPVHAQGGKEINLGVGYSLPMGSMGDVAAGGPQVGANFGFQVAPKVVLGVEVFYNMYGLSDETQAMVDAELGSDADMDINITQYTLSGKFMMMPTNSSVYSKFTAGMYKAAVTASLNGIDVTESESDFGVGVGLGYNFFGMGNTGGFVEAVYHNVFSEVESTSFIDLRGGVTLKFL